MDITYLISAHTDPQQLGRLLKSLEDHQCSFIIHIDKQVDIAPFIAAAEGVQNVSFLSNRYRISWGTISIVKYQMALIKEALNKNKDSFLISLSGLDYPIWSNTRIQHFVDSLNGKEMIYGSMIESKNEWYSISRPYLNLSFFGKVANMRIRKLLRIIVKATGYRKKLFVKLENQAIWPLYKGGAWWGISYSLAKEIYTTYHNSTKLQRYFIDLFAPDEIVPQTIAFNSSFRDKCKLLDPESATFNDITPLHYLEYGGKMKVLTDDDYEKIIQSGKPFARKFMTNVSDTLMDRIDKERRSM